MRPSVLPRTFSIQNQVLTILKAISVSPEICRIKKILIAWVVNKTVQPLPSWKRIFQVFQVINVEAQHDPFPFVPADALPPGLVYFIVLIALTAWVFWVKLKRNGQICLYNSGLIRAYGSSTKLLRWEHIETFTRGTLETDPPGVDDLDWIRITGPNFLALALP